MRLCLKRSMLPRRTRPAPAADESSDESATRQLVHQLISQHNNLRSDSHGVPPPEDNIIHTLFFADLATTG